MDQARREWILAQIDEISKRHGKTDDETLGELLVAHVIESDVVF
jgi:hypothetical protein